MKPIPTAEEFLNRGLDDSEIKEGDYKWHHVTGIRKALVDGNYTNQFKITHSTQPLGFLDKTGITTANLKPDWTTVQQLSLSEIKGIVSGYEVLEIAEKILVAHSDFKAEGFSEYQNGRLNGIIEGIEAHQELVKDKLFTIGDMIRAFLFGSNPGVNYQSLININNWEDAENYAKVDFSDFKKSLLPKTEWDIEFNHGKIKLI